MYAALPRQLEDGLWYDPGVNLEQLDIPWIFLNLVIIFGSLSLHESAHAWTADRLGDDTGRRLGRVTMNPIPHIDPVGTILFPLIGVLVGGPVFGWAKPVPVQPYRLGNPRRDHVLVAAAGPISNLLAAGIFLIVLRFFGLIGFGVVSEWPGGSFLLLSCQLGLLLNVILACFNLIPIPPLDGSWVLDGLLPERFSKLYGAIRPYGFLLLLLLLFSGAISSILGPILGVVETLAY